MQQDIVMTMRQEGLKRVVDLTVKPNFCLQVTFNDGRSGECCFSMSELTGVFAPLSDPSIFAQASVDQYGVINWPTGADLDSQVLYQRIIQS